MPCSIHGKAGLHSFKDGTEHNHHIMPKGATEKEDLNNHEPAALVKSKDPHNKKDPGCHVTKNGETFTRPAIGIDNIGGNLGLFAPNNKGEPTGIGPDCNHEGSIGDTVHNF